jgi:hypothetical protein
LEPAAEVGGVGAVAEVVELDVRVVALAGPGEGVAVEGFAAERRAGGVVDVRRAVGVVPVPLDDRAAAELGLLG